jgi:hypothetical protein
MSGINHHPLVSKAEEIADEVTFWFIILYYTCLVSTGGVSNSILLGGNMSHVPYCHLSNSIIINSSIIEDTFFFSGFEEN